MIGSAISGILSGLGGSLLTNVFNIFSQKQKNKHDIAMADVRIRELKAEHEANIQQITVEGNIKQELAAEASFSTSQRYGNKTAAPTKLIGKLFESNWTKIFGVVLVFLLGIVDVIRTSIRPAITIVLMYITGYITFQYISFVEIDVNLVDKTQVLLILDSIIYLTFTVVGWWFGDRRMAKHSYRLSDGNKQEK